MAGLYAFVAIGLDESGRDSKAVLTAKATSAWIGVWFGATLAGWLIGRHADREITDIRVISEASTETGR